MGCYVMAAVVLRRSLSYGVSLVEGPGLVHSIHTWACKKYSSRRNLLYTIARVGVFISASCGHNLEVVIEYRDTVHYLGLLLPCWFVQF